MPTMTRSLQLAILFIFILGLTGLSGSVCFGQSTRTKQPLPDRKVPSAVTDENNSDVPLSIFADIERGWKGGKEEPLLRHFGQRKVAISIGGAGPKGGYFSKSQSHYLFKDLFKYTITKKFEFTQYRNIHNGNRKVYAVAEREYKRRDDGRLFKDKIYVSLQRENERWVISEIKSIH
jgi:hypothetical protein